MQRHEQLTAAIANHLDRLITPALVIDLGSVEHNATSMVQRCEGAERWRPHVKTVKQAAVIEVLLDSGVRHFKCATVDELAMVLGTARKKNAQVDVLVAYPLQEPPCRAVLAVRREHSESTVSLLADSPGHAADLSDWCNREDGPVGVFLDVDLGMNRTGTPPEVWDAALGEGITAKLANLEVCGLHGYDGHHRWGDRAAAWIGYDRLCELAAKLEGDDYDIVTSGTHSYAHALEHARLRSGPWRHQVSAGTIVLSDLRSDHAARDLGLRQAAFVATRVVHIGQGRVTLDAGSKGISPDMAPPACQIVGWPGLEPQRASEEHLPVDVGSGVAPTLGELLWLIPKHVCTTVNLYRHAIWLRNGRYVGHGPIDAASHPLWTTPPRTPA